MATASHNHCPPRCGVGGQLDEWLGKHRMRNQGSHNSAGALHGDIGAGPRSRRIPAKGEHRADRRVEMGARDRPERGDQHKKDRARGDRVAKKGERLVAAGKPLGHHPRADHGCDEQQGAERFGGELRNVSGAIISGAPGLRRTFPSRFVCSAAEGGPSRDRQSKENRDRLLEHAGKASRKALPLICLGLPRPPRGRRCPGGRSSADQARSGIFRRRRRRRR